MRRARITIIPIKGGYKWRVKRYTGNLIADNFESILEYPTAESAAKTLTDYLKKWEPIWNKHEDKNN